MLTHGCDEPAGVVVPNGFRLQLQSAAMAQSAEDDSRDSYLCNKELQHSAVVLMNERPCGHAGVL